MDYTEFSYFLSVHDPLEYIPDGYIMCPIGIDSALHGYIVWMMPEDIVRKAQKGI